MPSIKYDDKIKYKVINILWKKYIIKIWIWFLQIRKKEVSDTLLNAISKYIYVYAVYTRM